MIKFEEKEKNERLKATGQFGSSRNERRNKLNEIREEKEKNRI